MRKIRIILAEDHLVVRNGIKLLLDSQDNFEVVGEVGSGKEVLDLLTSGTEADILITDLSMHNIDGLQLMKEIESRNIALKVIVLTMLDCDQHVSKSFQSGAKAYLVKNVAAEEMIFCINHVAKGGRFLCEELTMKFIDKLIEKSVTQPTKIDPAELDLSSRELEVLELLGEGLTNLEISKRLFLSKRTVEGHRQSLIDKTKSKNTPALIKFAILNGLID
ncbi:response regulator [Sphingobacterium spiritivorum]|uniref:Response regulator receiver domain protein n=1 Tax=Sphingobacterium spiritivorum ATCC 33861 TaxID=525373 RepID=D7VIE4_SPHSI|nr:MULTISPECIES: response regulator transcription factor [Sphingobacterium]EFK59846.1 response regulator receiver domain protein [Sphingobacterium spiritivorum ATCC 33861]QQT27741.1 response regulator transcription factor [Sphingobacterium spiritivorum]QQT37515.1 response regulator transcription factor [Sphingobacterium spiritivorum]WQD34310.1 response regulator transcription factor [Sphingobacterium spiritivorum]SUI97135.1 Nitrogen regulation protein C [Sphingobacterium spiritivorum]